MFGQIDIFRQGLKKSCEFLTKPREKVPGKTAKRGRMVNGMAGGQVDFFLPRCYHILRIHGGNADESRFFAFDG